MGAIPFTQQTTPATTYGGWLNAVSGNAATTLEIHDRLMQRGGLVGNINPGRISAATAAAGASGTPIVLNWPDGTSSRMSAEGAVAEEIVRVFQRASLQRGRRK